MNFPFHHDPEVLSADPILIIHPVTNGLMKLFYDWGGDDLLHRYQFIHVHQNLTPVKTIPGEPIKREKCS